MSSIKKIKKMKKFKYITVAVGALIALSCTKSQFDDFEATSGGSADFSNYIAVGNSLTQGFQDGGLHNEYQAQENSFPAIIAQQMGTSFLQPMVSGAGSGHRFLQELGETPTVVSVASEADWSATGWSSWDKNTSYNNLGVAGIRLTDCVPTAGDPFSPSINQVLTTLNPFGGYLDFGASPLTPISYLEHVKNSNATFFTCWLGNNDVLGWSTNGGTDGTVTIPGVGSVNTSELTPVSVFRSKYDSILNAFSDMGASGICATLPYVTSIPFFNTVPHNPIPMDPATVAAVNAGYATYNSTLDGLALAGNISLEEAAQRQINFTAGTSNAIVIMDESLTDLTGVNPALLSMRQATANDLILLTSSSSIGQVFSPTAIYGVSVPFADTLVLTETEVQEVTNHTDMLNNEIRASAAAYGVPVVDMNAFMQTLQSGLTFDGVDYGADYISGGSFSLDGVHPNQRGYAIIANKFMEEINANYGSNLRPVAVQNYRGIIFP